MKFLAAVLMLLTAFPAFAEESGKTVIKEEKGIRFNLPPDWPIEERNGVIGPIPIEEYLAKKFAAANNRIDELQSRLEVQDKRIRVLEQELRRSRAAAEAAAKAAEAPKQ